MTIHCMQNTSINWYWFKLQAIEAGPVAQWITRLTTDQKIPGSNPGRFGSFSSK